MIKNEKQAPHPTGTSVDEGQSMYQNEQQDTRQHLSRLHPPPFYSDILKYYGSRVSLNDFTYALSISMLMLMFFSR